MIFVALFSIFQDAVPLRLSSHQINLLLSSIWAQSVSPDNSPEDYVALAHTYCLMLLFSRAKVVIDPVITCLLSVTMLELHYELELTDLFLRWAQTSFRDALVRSFQLAFTLRDVSLAAEGNRKNSFYDDCFRLDSVFVSIISYLSTLRRIFSMNRLLLFRSFASITSQVTLHAVDFDDILRVEGLQYYSDNRTCQDYTHD